MVTGSNPVAATTGAPFMAPRALGPVGQVVKTPPFHGGNMGSNPVRVTTSACRCRFRFRPSWNGQNLHLCGCLLIQIEPAPLGFDLRYGETAREQETACRCRFRFRPSWNGQNLHLCGCLLIQIEPAPLGFDLRYGETAREQETHENMETSTPGGLAQLVRAHASHA